MRIDASTAAVAEAGVHVQLPAHAFVVIAAASVATGTNRKVSCRRQRDVARDEWKRERIGRLDFLRSNNQHETEVGDATITHAVHVINRNALLSGAADAVAMSRTLRLLTLNTSA